MHPNAVLEKLLFFGRGLVCADLAHGLRFVCKKVRFLVLFTCKNGGVCVWDALRAAYLAVGSVFFNASR